MTQMLTNIGGLAQCLPSANQQDVHFISDAALVWSEETICWVGQETELPSAYRRLPEEKRHDAQGGLVVPGFIDCHTHLAFGGWRADEFASRCRGASYLEIARAGGGIASTVNMTREATEDDLIEKSSTFLEQMIKFGVTTVECKTGYGLSEVEELKLLRVYQRLQSNTPVQLVPTLLAAHVIPPEYRDDRQAYVELICEKIIPQVSARNLAAFCDVFIEESAFSIEEARQILTCGIEHGLKPKLHADQLSAGGGAQLAAELKASSADHLECADEAGIRSLAEAGTVAVALPLASLYLSQTPLDARSVIDAGVPVAVATDFNPGSSPSFSLPLAMTLACVMNRMTPEESLVGVTRNAARAVGMHDRIGSLAVKMRANFVVLDAPTINQFVYHYRSENVPGTYISGECVFQQTRSRSSSSNHPK